MTESNQIPQLSLNLTPEVPETEAPVTESIQQATPAPVQPEPAPELDDSILSDAERQAIDVFLKQLDINNPEHVLRYGADAQKRIADFSDTALNAVKAQETGEVGEMLVNLVTELKGFEADSEEPKGLRKLFAKGESKITRMKARYDSVSVDVEKIADSL